MTWITAAVAVAAIMAIVNVVDSHIISKRMPSLGAFLIPAGSVHLVFGLIILAVHPPAEGVEAFTWFIAVVAAITRVAAVLPMLYVMRTEEVSRIIPVVYAHPVFVAVLAVPLLDERLIAVQWVAILMTVGGAALISLKGQGRATRLRRSFGMLLVSSLLFGVANVATKYASDSVPFWNMYSLTAMALGLGFYLVALRPTVIRELKEMPGRGSTLSLIGANETIALAGIVLSFWAIEKGPVSLVSTVMGIRPFFVFLYALALSRFFPAVLDEGFARGTAVLKVVSIGLIVGGVAIINLVE
jgi:drug/metabolite transporter (DMT)-like permease